MLRYLSGSVTVAYIELVTVKQPCPLLPTLRATQQWVESTKVTSLERNTSVALLPTLGVSLQKLNPVSHKAKESSPTTEDRLSGTTPSKAVTTGQDA